MTEITFKHTSDDETRILADGKAVSDLYHYPNVLKPDAVEFIAHLAENWHVLVRIHDRPRVRETVARIVDTHTLLSETLPQRRGREEAIRRDCPL